MARLHVVQTGSACDDERKICSEMSSSRFTPPSGRVSGEIPLFGDQSAGCHVCLLCSPLLPDGSNLQIELIWNLKPKASFNTHALHVQWPLQNKRVLSFE